MSRRDERFLTSERESERRGPDLVEPDGTGGRDEEEGDVSEGGAATADRRRLDGIFFRWRDGQRNVLEMVVKSNGVRRKLEGLPAVCGAMIHTRLGGPGLPNSVGQVADFRNQQAREQMRCHKLKQAKRQRRSSISS